MMLLPYKLDHRLYHQSWVTYAIAVFCLGIYYIQSVNTPHIEKVAESFCAQNHSMSFTDLTQRASEVHKIVSSPEQACQNLMINLHAMKQPYALIKSTAEEEIANFPDGKYTVSQLALSIDMVYAAFRDRAPTDITSVLSYEAGSFNPISGFLSAFAHADWSHVIGNLIFFLAFAGVVEAFIGNTGRFLLTLFVLEAVIDLTWSVANIDSPYMTSLGLSGLVSAMIGFAAYAVPRARVRCLFGFIVYFWHGSVAIWLLALWFIGWDVYYLNSTGASSINYLAHVVGALGGYVVAVLFFRQRKVALQADIDQEIRRYKLDRVDRLGRA